MELNFNKKTSFTKKKLKLRETNTVLSQSNFSEVKNLKSEINSTKESISKINYAFIFPTAIRIDTTQSTVI